MANLDNRLSQNEQDSRQNHKVYRENHEKLQCRIDSRKKKFVEVKILRSIFQGNALFPLSFVLTMILLSYVLRKCTVVYKLTKSRGKINHLMYIKLSANMKKNWKP